MSFYTLPDGLDFTEDDFLTLMEQGLATFATRAARTAALSTAYVGGAVVPDGFTSWLVDEQVVEQYIGGVWEVKSAKRQRQRLGVAYTPPVSGSAANATTFASFLLKAGCTYRVRGNLWVPTGTLRVTSMASTGTFVGVWGSASGANLFDQVSAASTFPLVTGHNAISGEITCGTSNATWLVQGYSQAASGTVDQYSVIEIERIS